MSIPRPDRCERHRKFASQRDAENELGKIALRYAIRGDDRTWALLKPFACGDHWHIGRDWQARKNNFAEGAR